MKLEDFFFETFTHSHRQLTKPTIKQNLERSFLHSGEHIGS